MQKQINWFRLILDRKTHDAKFRTYTGTGQEINLQIQAELDKATKQVNELLNRIDRLEELNTCQANIIERQLQTIHEASANASKQLQHEESITILEETIAERDAEIHTLKTNAVIIKQKIQLMEQTHIQQLKDQLDGLLADSVPKNRKCALLRVEITYDQYDDAGMQIHSQRVATTINPRQQKNEIAIRLRNLLEYLKTRKP